MFFKRKTAPKGIRKKTGDYGEDLAAHFLQKKGYTILARNYRKKFGEIDIIAKHEESLVFIEVKTRKSQRFGTGFEAVDYKKQLQLSRIAQDYISSHEMIDMDARFDVVSIMLSPETEPKIEIIANAFEFQE